MAIVADPAPNAKFRQSVFSGNADDVDPLMHIFEAEGVFMLSSDDGDIKAFGKKGEA